ncbi:hypothetical protein XELAEV_18004592mg, partial [Xenopus laevis]
LSTVFFKVLSISVLFVSLSTMLLEVSTVAFSLRTFVNSFPASSMTKTIRSREHLFNTPIHLRQKSGFVRPIVGVLRIRNPRGIFFARK